MSTANLNVWITDIGDPCHITNTQYFVTIVDCGGNVLEWCGKKYSFIKTQCGHVEIEIPPGCYAVFAGQDPQGIGIPPFGNLLTHIQVVRANCGDHICVNLFAPTLHYCGTWFTKALRQVVNVGPPNFDPKLAATALRAVQALLDNVGPDDFTQNTLAVFDQGPPTEG
jgi:hypothetical protein